MNKQLSRLVLRMTPQEKELMLGVATRDNRPLSLWARHVLLVALANDPHLRELRKVEEEKERIEIERSIKNVEDRYKDQDMSPAPAKLVTKSLLDNSIE